MAKEIKTEILIQATPDKVWSILSDFEQYPHWNPFIKSIKGKASVGNTLTVKIGAPGAKEMTFKPKVLSSITSKELKWIGHLLFPGIFDGTHRFELVDQGDGTTLFRQSELFKGILVPFLQKQLDVNTRKGFEEMNEQLKMLAEQP